MTESVAHEYESFAAARYPSHYRRLCAARRALRFPVIKSVVLTNAIFGAPLCGAVWGARLLLEAHAASLQEGAHPLPFLADIDAYAQVVMVAILVLCTLVGVAVGFARSRRYSLLVEDHEMRLRTAFVLDEWSESKPTAAPFQSREGFNPAGQAESDVVIRRPQRNSEASAFPPFTDVESSDREGPSVAPGDFLSQDPRGSFSRSARPQR